VTRYLGGGGSLLDLGGNIGGDAVEIALALAGDAAATAKEKKEEEGSKMKPTKYLNSIPVGLVVLNDLELLERLEGVAGNRARAIDVVRGARATVDRATVGAGEGTETDTGLEVDGAGDRGSAHVVPVRVIGSELLVCSSLDDVNPLGDLELALKQRRRGEKKGQRLIQSCSFFFSYCNTERLR